MIHALPDCQGCPAGLPAHLFESLVRYATKHVPTGGFLLACLDNNLCDAVCLADPESLAALPVIVRFIHCDLPSKCHGSREAVRAWLEAKAVLGGRFPTAAVS